MSRKKLELFSHSSKTSINPKTNVFQSCLSHNSKEEAKAGKMKGKGKQKCCNGTPISILPQMKESLHQAILTLHNFGKAFVLA